MKISLFIILSILILILIIFAFYLIIGQILFYAVLTNKGKYFKKFRNKSLEKIREMDTSIFKNYQKLEIEGWDKMKLAGFYKDNNCDKLAILVHGFGSSHYEMKDYASIFEKRGYDILAIDNRGHGESEGYILTMGENEREDLLLWINKMLELKPKLKIVLFGVSMGGTIVTLAAGENYKNIVLAIEDGGYDNAETLYKYLFAKKRIYKPLYKLFYNYIKKTKFINLSKVDTVSKLKQCKLPILFIHGAKDTLVPLEMMYNMSTQIPEHRRQTYVVSDAGHGNAYGQNPKQYEREIDKFLSKYKM